MRLARRYRGARAAVGPLLFLEGTLGAVLGEQVVLSPSGSGEALRGQVIDAGEEITVVQVLDETLGLRPGEVDVVLTGALATVTVGDELLGRVLTGGGDPRDGLPAPVGEGRRSLVGLPINPVRRAPPRELIETGLSAIEGLDTLVRGQKLPIFSGPGLPGLDLAARIVEQSAVRGGEEFVVVFAGIGITERESRDFVARLEGSGALERSVLFLNHAADPTVERLLAPRMALGVAEHFAFEKGRHVLVVIADITHYCEALREIASAREEVPGRRGYPGSMYTDLASLFERAGILPGSSGSITQVPVLTVPDDDITHPIPDLVGYITEGQIVLGRELHQRGISPPIDLLPSLSRLMGSGIGAGRTAAEHREWADQIYALYARGREARLMAAIVGESGLTAPDRRALEVAERVERELVHQGDRRRDVTETLEIGWRILESVPREDLMRIRAATWERRDRQRAGREGADAEPPAEDAS